jgi:hypothetical protein
MTDSPLAPELLLSRLSVNRRLILWTHAGLAAILAFTQLSHLNLAGSHYWGRGFDIFVLTRVASAWVPYAISAVYAAKVITYIRVRVWAFLAVLLIGATAQELYFLGVIRIDQSAPEAFLSLAGLSAAYVWAAELIMHVDDLEWLH